MPIHEGHDSKGHYVQWGGKGAKYYYKKGDKKAKAAAYKKAGKQAAAAKHSGYVGNKRSEAMLTFNYVTTNLKTTVRQDTMEGRDWIVAPAQMITEGVHNGSDGPIFYPAEELAKLPSVWNHKPVVVYHPTVNGQSVSACDPDQITARKVGVLMNTVWNAETRKLGTETWLDPARVQTIDYRVAEAIDNNEMMEVSTGLYMELEKTKGVWNGEEYEAIAHNLQPDHLALLPDVKGACSIADGAGFLRTNEESRKIMINELSHGSIRALLSSAVHEAKDNAWIEEIYDTYFIYEQEGKIYKQTYSKNASGVSLNGLPKLVEKIVTYKEIMTLAANSNVNKKGNSMDKSKIVDSLIANKRTSWTEDDRESLMNLEEKMLGQLSESFKEQKQEPAVNEKKEEQQEVPNNTPTGNTPAEPRKLTAKEYVNQAPPEIKEFLETSMATLDAEKTHLIETIMANERNTFTQEHLNSFHVNQLRAIAKIAVAEKPKTNAEDGLYPLYLGNGSNPVDNKELPEPLPLPVMNFDEKA